MKIDTRFYTECSKELWTGRIDDPDDPEALRMHQVIRLFNLIKIKELKIDESQLNICLIGFCCDLGVQKNLGRTGAVNGPKVIRKELANLPAHFTGMVNIYDAGDILAAGDDLAQIQQQLSYAVKTILDHKMFPIVLGGGHELALGSYNGIDEHLRQQSTSRKAPAIINFDAHLDFRPFKDNGSSGSMFHQIAQNCNRESRKFAYLCFGAQTSGNTRSLFKRVESYGGSFILAKNTSEIKHNEINKQLDDYIARHDDIYLTVCSDVFNSAYAPGVSAPQPFGLNPETALIFIKHVLKSKKVIGFDIAEVSPRFDHDNITAKLAAIIIYAVINTLTKNRIAK